MNRFYLPPEDWEDGSLSLSGDEAKHCARVMRACVGDEIEVFDGAGRSAHCRITEIARDLVCCNILNQLKHPTPIHPITLCQAIPKGGNMELIVQKSVELGVSNIQPLITDHTIARPESLAKKRQKWQRIALEACKQCGQNHLPEIAEPMPFGSWLDGKKDHGTALVAALDENAVHLKTHFANDPPEANISLLIGPEGDFSPAEYQAAFQAGFQPITFGNIVLRVETASLYGLSILQHELSCMHL